MNPAGAAPILDLDDDSRAALQFDALLRIVAESASTAPGARAVEALVPLDEEERVREETALVEEMRARVLRDGALVAGGMPDPCEGLEMLAVADLRLPPERLRDVALSLHAANRIARFAGEGEPGLTGLARGVPRFDREVEEILSGVEPDGRIADHASPRLAECRRRRLRLAGKLRRRLEALVQAPETAGAMQDRFVTQRNGRYVVPVRADAAQPIRGIVHATSSSGATRFVEPLDSVEANNELVQLADEEREEEERIAEAWGAALRARREELSRAVDAVARFDSLQARARFAERVGGVAADVRAGNPLRLRGLRHPLLARHLEETGGTCVPLDLELDPAERVLVVSGPNTGGKTVALKSLGLAVLMAQCGVPLAADEAKLPFYAQVRADVGDHQSIANDLSTFSGHVHALARSLERRHPPALYLFDEIGNGTDPAEGAALARAVLEALAGPGVTVVVTTHQNALKRWAFVDERASSAAMEFDTETLRPTFRILPDIVGLSAGLEIAERCGLDPAVIARSRELLGDEASRSEAFMNRLRERTLELDRLEAETRARLADEERERRERADALEADRLRRRKEFERSAARVLRDLRKRARGAPGRIDDLAARREAELVAAREERELKRRLVATAGLEDPAHRIPEGWPAVDAAAPGEEVYVTSLGRAGRVHAVDGRRVEVTVGRMNVAVTLADLRRPPRRESSAPKQGGRETGGTSVRSLSAGASTDELVLVGKRVEEALDAIDRFFDRALLAERTQVRLVHGHGSGRLRSAIREHLRRSPLVASYRAGDEHEGGDAATIAVLR